MLWSHYLRLRRQGYTMEKSILHILIQYTLVQPHWKMESNSSPFKFGVALWCLSELRDCGEGDMAWLLELGQKRLFLPSSSGVFSLGTVWGHVSWVCLHRDHCAGEATWRPSSWQRSWAPRQEQHQRSVTRVSCLEVTHTGSASPRSWPQPPRMRARSHLAATLWTVARSLLCPWGSQAGILEWVALPSSRGSSRPRDGTTSLISPTLAGGFLAPSGKPWPPDCKCLRDPKGEQPF